MITTSSMSDPIVVRPRQTVFQSFALNKTYISRLFLPRGFGFLFIVYYSENENVIKLGEFDSRCMPANGFEINREWPNTLKLQITNLGFNAKEVSAVAL